jgi:hypothetical protein
VKFDFDIDTLDGSIHARYESQQAQRRRTGGLNEESRQGPLAKTTPPLRPTASLSKRHPQPSKENRDTFSREYLQRPLPELPLPELPKKKTAFIDVTRSVSVTSRAPSVAPSLVDYVDEESFDDDEEVETGIALAIPISLSGSINSMLAEQEGSIDDKQRSDTASSEYDASLASTEKGSVASQDLLSPRNYLPTTGTSLEQGFASLSMARPRQTTDRDVLDQCQAHRMANVVYEDNGTLKVRGLRLCESEWMRRTPSPVPDRKGDSIPRG